MHAHDWHAGLAPAYLAFARRAAAPRVGSVFTVHNLAYQGLFAPWHFGELGLPADAFGIDGLEYHGQLSFMKAGLYFADRITTVSPTYAREIQTPEQGCGLDGLLRSRAGVLTGILNGVDDAGLEPGHRRADCRSRYDVRRAGRQGALQGRAAAANSAWRAAPTRRCSCVVSRLTEQKGLHLVLGGARRAAGAGRPAGPAGQRRRLAGSGLPRSAPPRTPSRSASRSATTRRWRTGSSAAAT